MELTKKTVIITLTEEMLGTKSNNPQVFTDYQLKDCPAENKEEETENAKTTAEALADIEKGTTVFHIVDGKPGIYAYQLKGFFKAAASALSKADGTKTKELKAFKKAVDTMIFVAPRFIPLILPEGATLGICERPLRAGTPQGERVTLARSQTAPIGTQIKVEITMLAKSLLPYVNEWLDYGAFYGLGQWRNAGKGSFTAEETK